MRVRRTLRFIYKMLELAANGPAKYDIILMPAAHTHTHAHTRTHTHAHTHAHTHTHTHAATVGRRTRSCLSATLLTLAQ
jgi:ABC-type nickel/cobalt efflux system permease component RcnA